MKTFIYFSQGEWRTFQAEELPVKPDFKDLKDDHVYKDYIFYTGYKDADVMQQYESEIAALKAKSLKVGNPDVIPRVGNDGFPIFERTGAIHQWPGTVSRKKKAVVTSGGVATYEITAILKLPNL